MMDPGMESERQIAETGNNQSVSCWADIEQVSDCHNGHVVENY
jgi:hypothetical protein